MAMSCNLPQTHRLWLQCHNAKPAAGEYKESLLLEDVRHVR